MVYGIAIVSTVHASRRSPSLIIGAIFNFLTFEFMFAMATMIHAFAAAFVLASG